MAVGSRKLGSMIINFLLLLFINNTMARSYRRTGYKYDTLLNPISRVYFQRQRNTAVRSIEGVEPVELALISNLALNRKYEIGVPGESFGKKINKLKDPEMQIYKVDVIRVNEKTAPKPSMKKTLNRILHRISF